ncbi:hypothetical protein U1Q18_049467 [Sarracenia purpurea var. burkii]
MKSLSDDQSGRRTRTNLVRLSDAEVPHDAYLRRARLRISGTAGGAVEAYAAGTCESGGNASGFAMKLSLQELFFGYPTPIFGVFPFTT